VAQRTLRIKEGGGQKNPTQTSTRVVRYYAISFSQVLFFLKQSALGRLVNLDLAIFFRLLRFRANVC